MKNLSIRIYQSSDGKELAELFYNTIHAVNAEDYTEEQLNVWAAGSADLKRWNESLSANITYVAVKDDVIVGFGDIDHTGYLARLFVHKDYQREGIASAICDQLEQAVQGRKIITHASITAKPFFEKRGYKVVKEQRAQRQGMYLTNYLMSHSRHDRQEDIPCFNQRY